MNLELKDPIILDWSSTLVAEKIVLGLLGKILFEYPDKEWLKSLLDEGVFDEIPFAADQPDVLAGQALIKKWSIENESGMSSELFEDLEVDYNRLFIGPGKVLAPPWESIYFHKERVIFQEQTLQVREWYRRYGFESVKLYSEPDDHIGLELAFVAQLAGLGLEALEQQDQAKFEQLLDAQVKFLSEHPLRWAAGWVKQVEEHARTDFFRGIALIVKGVLTELLSILR